MGYKGDRLAKTHGGFAQGGAGLLPAQFSAINGTAQSKCVAAAYALIGAADDVCGLERCFGWLGLKFLSPSSRFEQ